MSDSDKKQSKEIVDVTIGSTRYPDVVYRHRPGSITEVIRKDQEITFITQNHVVLIISVITPDIIRLNYALDGDFTHNFSYAIDPDFVREPVTMEFNEHEKYYQITTETLDCRITKENLLIHFYDHDNNVLCEDMHGFYRRDSLMKGISEVKVTKKAPDGTAYYGLGDKPTTQNLRGKAYENWNTDSYAFKRGQDPLYRSIPFYIAHNGELAYGIFFDNSFRTRFSFDRKNNNISSFSATGGQMNYYFINGPDLLSVARRYTTLTGTPDMPPMWSLGYHQCRWSYFPESRVREIADTFRKKEIPCDAIYLDIDYMDGYRVFTWDSDHFPDPENLVKSLKGDGFKTVVMIDPGVRVDHDYPVFSEGKEKDYFCKRQDGDLMIGPVWPPRCVFPDFTDPEVRAWWAGLYADFLRDTGVAGVWNDMNEPAVFEVERKTFPDSIRHNYDGHPCSHKKAHNIYGMQMSRASYEGIKKQIPDKRPFLLTRANYSGGQRYAALWTGDNIASWDHLRLANEQCQRLSISGYSFCGSDIGGFVKNPTPELYARWVQLGIFHPLFRTHSMGFNVDGAAAVKKEEVQEKKAKEKDTDQEPWSFGDEVESVARDAINLRYRLLSYLYTEMWKYVKRGQPLLKPLPFYDQQDPETLEKEDHFIFGEHILACPVLEEGQSRKGVYLPKGNWYDFRNDEFFEGRNHIEIETPLSRIPVFIKAGTVLPVRELMQYTGQRMPEKLSLLAYHSDTPAESELYEDAEEGFEYREGAFRHTRFRYEWDPSGNVVTVTADRDGSYSPPYSRMEMTLIGLPGEVLSCTVDAAGQEVESVTRNGSAVHRLNLDPDFKTVSLSIK